MRGEVIAPAPRAADGVPASAGGVPASADGSPGRADSVTDPVDGLPRPGRCLVLGILTVTPDAFSDGGKTFRPDLAISHGLDLLRRGADIIDVGGESVRPGAARISLAEEMRRVLPVVAELAAAGAVVSVDTTRARVAQAALAAGARMVNDISGGLADPAMLPLAADRGFPYVLMHWRARSGAGYRDVVAEVLAELADRIAAARRAGVAADRLIVDPGIGLAKTDDQSWRILARMNEFRRLGCPVLIGAPGRSFLGRLLADRSGDRPPDRRDSASAALSALAARAGMWGVRVHDVDSSLDAVRVAAALSEAGRAQDPPARSRAATTVHIQ
jgi:dihydropteroate synthase